MNMRKRIIAFLLLFVIGVFTLVACGEGDNGGDKPEEPVGEAILTENKEITIVFDSATISQEQVQALSSAVSGITGVAPAVKSGDVALAECEIVVGNSTREITEAATKRLNIGLRNAIRNSQDEDTAEEDLAAYTVYSDGNSIALVWTSDYGAAIVLDYFKENFVFDGLALAEGYSKTVVFSVTGYLEERANKMKDEAWTALAAQLPADKSEEIITALKQLYGLYSADVVDWMANLYDPGTGGFYFSNSARDNEGFLPDIETTYGVFGYMEASGMMEMYNGVWDDAIPDWLSDAVCDWFYDLQDEDGFFYHPQWPKEYIEQKGFQSRITRDRGSANTTLRKFGREPKYSSAYSNDANLLGGLGNSTVIAVSKVVPTAMMEQFASLENFQKYIATMDAEANAKGDAEKASYFYSKGNEFQSTVSYMTPEMKTLLIEFFDRHQSAESGMWSENLYYNSTNALHKVGAVYNSIGAPLKYTDKMIESTLEILLWTPDESPAGAGVDIYNALSCFTYIYKNVLTYGVGTEAERQATVDAYKARVYEEAVTIINYSFQQMTRFGYADGSFGYSPNTKGNGGTAQGCPVAVAGTKEGDVNGTYIASLDIIDHTMGMLDLIDYTVPLFTEQERYRFIKTVEQLGPVVKAGDEVVESITIDFEDAESDTDIPVEINMNQRDSNVYVRTKADGDHDLVVEATNWYASAATSAKRNANFSIRASSVAKNASVGVIEFTISFEDLITTSNFSVHFQNNSKGAIITYTVAIGKDGSHFYGTVNPPTGKGTDVKLYGGSGEEMTVRLEFYRNQGVTKAYIDGVFLSEYAKSTDVSFDSAMFEFQGGAQMTAIFDDIKVEKDNIPYVKETPGTPPIYTLPKLGAASYDFEKSTVGSTKYPKDMTVTPNNGTASIVRNDGGKALNLAGIGGGLKANPSLSIYNYDVVEGGNGYVFETDLIVNSAPDKDKHSNMVKLQFMNGSTDVFQLLLQTITVDGVHRMRIVDNADSNKSKDTADVLATFNEGENVKLRVEYAPSTKMINVYINDALVGTRKCAKSNAIQTFKLSINSGAAIDITIDDIGLTRQNLAVN